MKKEFRCNNTRNTNNNYLFSRRLREVSKNGVRTFYISQNTLLILCKKDSEKIYTNSI